MTERRRYRSFIQDSSRWDGFVHRDDDIVISTPAKCGTTWMQMLCALLIFQQPSPPKPLAEISPWLDMLTWKLEDVTALLEAQEHRRFIKTHTPLDGLPLDPRVTYVCVGRDPRDVVLSMENHMANINWEAALNARAAAVGLEDLADLVMPEIPDDPRERFWAWVAMEGPNDADPQGLAGILNHLETFWDRRDEPNVTLFHYADLQADLPGELRRLGGVLGIETPADRFDTLVEAASFDAMKKRAEHLAPDTQHGIWQDTARFFDQGRNGRWRDVVDEADMPRYFDRVGELVGPDLACWAHDGSRSR